MLIKQCEQEKWSLTNVERKCFMKKMISSQSLQYEFSSKTEMKLRINFQDKGNILDEFSIHSEGNIWSFGICRWFCTNDQSYNLLVGTKPFAQIRRLLWTGIFSKNMKQVGVKVGSLKVWEKGKHTPFSLELNAVKIKGNSFLNY